jgi:hypothetical protein
MDHASLRGSGGESGRCAVHVHWDCLRLLLRFRALASEAFAAEIDTVCMMHEAVEDGIGIRDRRSADASDRLAADW